LDLERDLAGLAGTFLGDLDLSTLTHLLAAATLIEAARGQVFGDGTARRTAFVVDGNVRVFITEPAGRQLTVRYARPGSLVVTTGNLAARLVSLKAQAITKSTLIGFDHPTFDRLRRTNKSFATALSAEQTRRLEDVYRAFAMTAFGSIRERLAAHLLDAAEPSSGGLVAPFTHRDLADALGSAREVVTRALGELQRDGAVGAVRGGIEILDTGRLAAIAGAWWSHTGGLWVDPANAEKTFEDSAHAIVAIDASGDIVYANTVAGRTFGRPTRELIGQPLASLLPASVGQAFGSRFEAWMEEPRHGPIGLGQRFHGRRADGSEFPAEITLLPATLASGRVIFARVMDVSYRDALRSLLQVRHEQAQVAVPVPA
jgi:CRP/FNR family cyclic AMP-dependent transcriptional regulator